MLKKRPQDNFKNPIHFIIILKHGLSANCVQDRKIGNSET